MKLWIYNMSLSSFVSLKSFSAFLNNRLFSNKHFVQLFCLIFFALNTCQLMLVLMCRYSSLPLTLCPVGLLLHFLCLSLHFSLNFLVAAAKRRYCNDFSLVCSSSFFQHGCFCIWVYIKPMSVLLFFVTVNIKNKILKFLIILCYISY